MKRLLSLGVAVATVAIVVTILPTPSNPTAEAFGTYNGLGQNAEHERITRVLSLDAVDGPVGVRFEPATLDVLAGTSGVLGAVGAPDNPFDSSAIPIKGLGPGKKHCDNGDFLDTPDYPRARSEAEATLRECIDYFDRLMSTAVTAAGDIITPNLTLNERHNTLNCSFNYDLRNTGSAKCQVINAMGRAIHLIQDFWTHSNWGDQAAPGPVTIDNPPGLGRSDVPSFLRYPVPAGYQLPEGLMSGCDDSADVPPVVRNCPDRVAHSKLAKDNGLIDPRTGEATPATKYPRALVGTNFADVVRGARAHTVALWEDLQQALRARYGDERATMMIDVIRRDSGLPCTVPDPSTQTVEGQLVAPAGAREEKPCLRNMRVEIDALSVTLRWNRVKKATYQVKMSRTDGSLPPRWRSLTTPRFTTRVTEPGTYEVRVRAVRGGQRITQVFRKWIVVPGPQTLPQICFEQPEACKGGHSII